MVNDPATRIVCLTFGHDAHDHPAYKVILTNAVRWVAQSDQDRRVAPAEEVAP